MKRIALAALAFLAFTSAAKADAMTCEQYRTTLADIARLQQETLNAADLIKAGLTAEAAKPQAAHFAERLTWLRATIMGATLSDAGTLRHTGAKGEPQFARCILWRAGEMEDHVQDVATDLAQLARGAAATIPLDRDEIAGEGLRKGCPS